MTEETTIEDVFASLNVSRILIAMLETMGEIAISTSLFVNAAAEDKELQVDYNSDDQTFTFKLKEKNEQRDDNNSVANDSE